MIVFNDPAKEIVLTGGIHSDWALDHNGSPLLSKPLVLFNFYNATKITLRNVIVTGHILAPFATIIDETASVDKKSYILGNVIANSMFANTVVFTEEIGWSKCCDYSNVVLPQSNCNKGADAQESSAGPVYQPSWEWLFILFWVLYAWV
jgi:hypothetical protein